MLVIKNYKLTAGLYCCKTGINTLKRLDNNYYAPFEDGKAYCLAAACLSVGPHCFRSFFFAEVACAAIEFSI